MKISSSRFRKRALLGTLLGGVALLFFQWPNLHFYWRPRQADFSVLRLGIEHSDARYFRLDQAGAQKLAKFIRQRSRPVYPHMATATMAGVYFFDADEECIYCLRLSMAIDSPHPVMIELDEIARSGKALSKAEIEALFADHGEYPIATRSAAGFD